MPKPVTPPVESLRADSQESGVSPFLDADALAVLKVDLKDIDLKALQDWVLQGVDDLRKTNKEIFRAKIDAKHELAQASDWIDKLRGAGAERIYAILDVYDITAQRAPFLVIPLEGGADPKAIEGSFSDLVPPGTPNSDSLQTEELDHAVIVAVPATLERLKKLQPQPRPELSQAFAAGKGQIHLAFIPSEDSRKTFESLVTDLPDELGGGSIEAVTRGMRWACWAIALPPSPSMRHVIQARDPAAAEKLKDIMNKGIEWVGNQNDLPPEAILFAGLVADLKPEVHGDQVVIDVKEGDTQQFAATFAVELLTARVAATQTQAMSNMRQLDLAILSYAHDHQGQLPDELGKALDPYLGQSVEKVWTDPIRPEQNRPYVYIKLSGSIASVKYPGECILLYEKHPTWDNGVNAAFVDGHVELFSSETEFKKYLSRTKEMNPGAVETPQ